MADFVQIKALLFKKALETEVLLKKGLRQVINYVEPYAEPKPEIKVEETVDPWIATKEVLLQNVPEKRKELVSILLENIKKDATARTSLFESLTDNPNAPSNLTNLLKILLPISVRVLSSTSLFDIVGVQPMKGPLEHVHVLKRTQSKVMITKEVVEAKPRKLSPAWTLEAEGSAGAPTPRGVDLEAELMCVIATEIVAELEQEVLSSYRRSADQVTAALPKGYLDLLNSNQHYSGEITKAIENQINSKLSMRNVNTGVFVVVSCAGLTYLQSEGTLTRCTEDETPSYNVGLIKYVGTLFSGKAKVYVDTYASNDAPILIGYKNPTSETEAPAIYAPYVILTTAGVLINPITMKQTVVLVTKYSYLETDIKDKLVSLTLT